ncbi:hypothetical protein QL093DRAFT_2370617, partial [Fusarium oxysporum]
ITGLATYTDAIVTLRPSQLQKLESLGLYYNSPEPAIICVECGFAINPTVPITTGNSTQYHFLRPVHVLRLVFLGDLDLGQNTKIFGTCALSNFLGPRC